MKFYFLTPEVCSLANPDRALLDGVKSAVLSRPGYCEASTVKDCDAIILQEQWSFKEWRYIAALISDPVVGRFANKVYTINVDDAASGLLRGIYTSLPMGRCYSDIHRTVPYPSFPNEAILAQKYRPRPEAKYLATWRGNPKSNEKLRTRLIKTCRQSAAFLVETTDSWLNHSVNEKEHYVELLLSGKFSLCPAGWAAVSFRIYESMALGICPVIIADDFIPPIGPEWRDFSIRVAENDLLNIEPILTNVSSSYLEMGRQAQEAWEQYFSQDKVMGYYADALLGCITASLGTGSPTEEIRRWKSLKTHWSNHWTLPQRLNIKLSKLTKHLSRRLRQPR